MTKWYYQRGDKQLGPVEEQQIGALVETDVIGAHTLVWSEDLDEWMPAYKTALKELLGGEEVAPPPLPGDAGRQQQPARAASQPAPSGQTAEYSNNTGVFKVMRIAFYIDAFYSALIGIWLIAAPLEDKYGIYDRAFSAPLYWIASIVAVISFSVFIARTNANAYFRTDGRHALPTWLVVVRYFIPVVNLWMPYRDLKRIAQALRVQTGNLAAYWWAGFVVSMVTGILGEILLSDAAGTNASLSTTMFLIAVSPIAWAVSAVIAVPLMKRLLEVQSHAV